jgi:hypothetical protein
VHRLGPDHRRDAVGGVVSRRPLQPTAGRNKYTNTHTLPSGKFSNYCTNCTIDSATLEGTQGTTVHELTCACKPLVGSDGFVQSTINLGMSTSNLCSHFGACY